MHVLHARATSRTTNNLFTRSQDNAARCEKGTRAHGCDSRCDRSGRARPDSRNKFHRIATLPASAINAKEEGSEKRLKMEMKTQNVNLRRLVLDAGSFNDAIDALIENGVPTRARAIMLARKFDPAGFNVWQHRRLNRG